MKLHSLHITLVVFFVFTQDGRCHFKASDVGATDKGYVDVEQGSEMKLKEACASIGPISVAIDASHQSFQLYAEGMSTVKLVFYNMKTSQTTW